MNSPYGQRSNCVYDSYTVAPLRGIHAHSALYYVIYTIHRYHSLVGIA